MTDELLIETALKPISESLSDFDKEIKTIKGILTSSEGLTKTAWNTYFDTSSKLLSSTAGGIGTINTLLTTWAKEQEQGTVRALAEGIVDAASDRVSGLVVGFVAGSIGSTTGVFAPVVAYAVDAALDGPVKSATRVVFDTAFTYFDETFDFFFDNEFDFSSNTASFSFRASKAGDLIHGGVADDLLFGDNGADRIYGNGGDDFLIGGGQRDDLRGGAGADALYGGAGNDKLRGGAGKDVLNGGGEGGDVLLGGGGDDIIVIGDLAATARGKINGGGGYDTLSITGQSAFLTNVRSIERIEVVAQDADIVGSAGKDVIDARQADAAYVDGGKGDDEILADIGDNVLRGDDGDDFIEGGIGKDRLLGGRGNDTLDGGAGNDRLVGSGGADTLNGGGGDDALFGASGDDVLRGGAGMDQLVGGAGDDVMDGGAGADILRGGAGNDIYVYDPLDTIIDDDFLTLDLRGHDVQSIDLDYLNQFDRLLVDKMFVTDSPFYTGEIVFHGISNVSVTLDMSETAQPGQFLGLLAGGAAFSFAEGAYFSVSVDAPSITSETLRDFGEGYDYSTEGYWWSIFGFDYDALATDTTLSARNTINFRYGADRAPGKDLIEYSFIGPYDYSHREEIFSEAQLGQGFAAADWKGRFSNKLSGFDQIVLRTSESVDPFDAFFFGDDPQIPDQELGVDFTVDAASKSGTAGFAYAPDGDWTLRYDRAFASGPDSMILWFE